MRSFEHNLFCESELSWHFVRSSGPGGQNVNKVSTAVELRFDVVNARGLNAETKVRLKKLAGRRMTGDGVLVIQAKRFRSQTRNRDDALNRLNQLVQAALIRPQQRKATTVSKAARLRRMQAKQLRSATKQKRRPVRDLD